MKIFSLFQLFFVLILFSCANQKVIVNEEITLLINQLYEIKILSKKGKEAFLKTVEGKPLPLFSLWEKSYNPRFSFSAKSSEDEEIAITASSILFQIYSIEYIHSSAEEALLDNFSFNILDNPKKIISEVEDLMGDNWKKYRPKRINYNSTENEISVVNNQLIWWIQTYSKLGLINDRVVSDAELWLKTSMEQKFHSRQRLVNFFKFIISKILFYDNESVYSLEQKSYLDTLLNNNLISVENYNTLLESYKPNEVKRQMEILSFMPNSFIFELKNFKSEYPNYNANYIAFLDTLKTHLIPDIRIDSIYSFSKEFVDDEYGGTYENEILSITLNGKEYWQTASNLFPSYSENTPIIMGTVYQSDVSFIQEYLCDQNSPYRLFMIEDKDRLRNERGTKLGIILLDSNQVNVLADLPCTFLELQPFSYYHHINSFDTIFSTIKQLQTIGIATQLNDKEIIELIPEIRLSSFGDIRSILTHLPNVVADLDLIYYDEIDDPTYTFPKLINRLSKASNGMFIPQNIRKGWKEYSEDKTFPSEVGFTLNGKEYYSEIKDGREGNEYLEAENLIKLVNVALLEAKIDGQFYCIDSYRYSCYNYIYLSITQQDWINKNYPEIFQLKD